MNGIRKILKFGPGVKTLSVVLLLATVAALVPICLLTRYAIPFFDDYGYSAPVWVYYMQGGFRPKGVIAGAIKNALFMRYMWQGTYGSIFLMGLNPMVFGEQYYYLGCLFLIVNFTLSVFAFVGILVKKVFQGKGFTILGMQAGVFLLVLLYLYSPQQGFYWFNGGIHYLGMMSFELYYLSVLLLLLLPKKGTEKKVLHIILTVVGVIVSMGLAFLVAGANFVTALQTPILILSAMALALILKKKRALLFLPSLIVYGVGLYFNISAPGNAVRQACYPNTPGAVESVLRSFTESVKYFREFSDWRTLLHLFLLFPVVWVLVRPDGKKRYPLWGVPVLAFWSVCVFAATFTPGLYGTGEIVLDRMINVIKLTYHLLLVFNMVYFVGAFREFFSGECRIKKLQKFTDAINREEKVRVPILVILLWAGLSYLVYSKSPNKTGQYSVHGAVFYLWDKEAVRLKSEYNLRVVQLKMPEQDIVFEPYSVRPWFLIWKDLSTNPAADENREMAYYYGKKTVRIREQ